MTTSELKQVEEARQVPATMPEGWLAFRHNHINIGIADELFYYNTTTKQLFLNSVEVDTEAMANMGVRLDRLLKNENRELNYVGQAMSPDQIGEYALNLKWQGVNVSLGDVFYRPEDADKKTKAQTIVEEARKAVRDLAKE